MYLDCEDQSKLVIFSVMTIDLSAYISPFAPSLSQLFKDPGPSCWYPGCILQSPSREIQPKPPPPCSEIETPTIRNTTPSVNTTQAALKYNPIPNLFSIFALWHVSLIVTGHDAATYLQRTLHEQATSSCYVTYSTYLPIASTNPTVDFDFFWDNLSSTDD